MTHDVYGYRNGRPFAVLMRKSGTSPTFAALDAAPEAAEAAEPDGSLVWRTTAQMRTALELLAPGPHHAAERRFISELLQASLDEGGVWVRFH